MHLVLLETSGNQKFIFATNKLRENIGASQLTYRAGTYYLAHALRALGGPSLDVSSPADLRESLLDPDKNPPVDHPGGAGIEVMIATSGKALVLVEDRDKAQRLVSMTTHKALEDAPGLDLRGVVSGSFDPQNKPLYEVIAEVHKALDATRSDHPGPDLRFLRLPVVADCVSSGLPASSAQQDEEGRTVALSTVVTGKRTAAKQGRRRIDAILKDHDPSLALPSNLKRLEEALESLDWLGILHADGNGVGQIFLKFHQYTNTASASQWREYVDKQRRFSLALDVVTEKSFCRALEAARARGALTENDLISVVPIILGGDDLTVLLDGRYAAQFARDFLRFFEEETSHDGVISQLTQQAFGVKGLSSCAGLCICKPHFPFHAAYDLAESLLSSAKQVKRRVRRTNGQVVPCSALDYHVLYDASVSDLDRIRAQLVFGRYEHLTARPYVVTEPGRLAGASIMGWWQRRHWERLQERVEAMRATDPQDESHRRLPNSLLHNLRATLFEGRAVSDARLALINARYAEQGLGVVLGQQAPPSLFWDETVDGQAQSATGFLDALDIVEFWS